MKEKRDIDCENKLFVILGFDRLNLIKLLIPNRLLIYFSIMLKRAEDEDQKNSIIEEISQLNE